MFQWGDFMKYYFFQVTCFLTFICPLGHAKEFLVRFNPQINSAPEMFERQNGGVLEKISQPGNLFKWTSDQIPKLDASVVYIQPNFEITLFQNPSLIKNREALVKILEATPLATHRPIKDNPPIEAPPTQKSGPDPLLNNAWGIFAVSADKSWSSFSEGKGIIVAVTDTGVDYNHSDLTTNMWRNPGETPNNEKDDDQNGFIDDIVGWDFATDDNKPFDLTVSPMAILLKGGNPGHGTHVAGVIGARRYNHTGTAGVAPKVKLMALRFINEWGKGDTAHAVQAIDYAVANGARIINASWGEERKEEEDLALQEAIARAQTAEVIFVAAAGNGRANPQTMKAEGYDNDSDPKPMVPASYSFSNIVAVAALDNKDTLAPFSNWGNKSVKLGAPGVGILSTVPGNKYQDTIIDMSGIKVTWDGTSMAAPFVSGGLATVWSTSPESNYREVIHYLLSIVSPCEGLSGKIFSEGRLDLNGN